MWRAACCVLACNPAAVRVPLSHIAHKHQGTLVVLQGDSSPDGIGFAMYADMARTVCLGWLGYKFPWPLATARESKYQNIREYCNLLLGLIAIYQPAIDQ
jgi:hypothetical protein